MSRRDDDLEREIRTHLELEAAEREYDGQSSAGARQAARRAFGNVTIVREDARAVWTPIWLQQAGQDARYALRTARRTPLFTVGALLIFALGISASTTIFSALRAVVLAPLPFDRPDELVRISQTNPGRGIAEFSVSLPLFRDWRTRSTSWTDIAATRTGTVTALSLGEPKQLRARFTTWNLLPMLGVRPPVGRAFTAADDVVGGGLVAIISDRLWREAFASAPDAVGRTITFDGRSHVVIGVAPPDVVLVSDADVILPLVPFQEDRRGLSSLHVLGRLRPGVSIERARSEMAALTTRLATEYPDDSTGWGVMLAPLGDAVLGPTTPRVLYLLLSAAALLLVVACANLSGLLLVRASARRREMAIRAALGGGRGRIIRQLLVESACLAALGAIGGVVLTYAAVNALRTTVMAELPRANQIGIDIWVLVFACGVTAVAAVIAGLAPALLASRLDVQRGLREGSRTVSGGGHTSRNVLIVSQLALSIVLLTAAGLTLRTLAHLRSVDLGFTPDRILTVQVAPREAPETFVARLLQRVAVMPDVEQAGGTSGAPMTSGNTSLHVYPVGGQAIIPATKSIQADWRIVSTGYFGAMNTRIISGRDFTPRDDGAAAKVIIVNQSLARVVWGDADPIGRQVDLGGGGGEPATVIGLVQDMRAHDPGEAPAASFYMSLYRGLYGPITLVIRTRADAERLLPLIRAEVRALDPTLPVFDVKTMGQLVSDRLAPARLVAGLLAGFAAVATLLAVVGIYSVVSFATGQRTREVAVRLALGARREQVIRPLLREGVVLVAVGIGLGVACSLPVGHMMRGLLSDVSPTDPVAFASAIGLLAAASLVACYVPARRASRVNPVVLLRAD